MTSDSFKIKAEADSACTDWLYRINQGTWTAFTTPDGSGKFAIEELADQVENSTYLVEAKATLTVAEGDDIVIIAKPVKITTPKNATAPTITAEIVNVTEDSFTVSGISNYECENWICIINGVGQFFPPGKSSSRILTVKGLSQKTSYNVQLSAQRVYNQVVGQSSVASIETPGFTELASVDPINFASNDITMSWVAYAAGYTHKLLIKDENKIIVTISDLEGLSGSQTATMTAGQRKALLDYTILRQSFLATIELQTLKGNTLIGSSSVDLAIEALSGAMLTEVYDEDGIELLI